MNKETLSLAADCAQELVRRIAEYEIATRERMIDGYSVFEAINNPKLTGSIRRQSMELTRALADLRKP